MGALFQSILCTSVLLLSLSACAPKRVESSEERDARTAREKLTPVAKNLIGQSWCTYLAPPAEIEGFLRLSFSIDDTVKIERFNEFDGKPFGKQDKDMTALWMIDGNLLNVRTSRTESRTYALSFSEKNDIPTMKMREAGKKNSTSNMWNCNEGVDAPMPVEIKPTDPQVPDDLDDLFPSDEELQ